MFYALTMSVLYKAWSNLVKYPNDNPDNHAETDLDLLAIIASAMLTGTSS